MPDKILDDRRVALEEAWFASHNEALRRQMIAADSSKAQHDGLAQATGIRDEAVLAAMQRLGLAGETVAALTMVPLVLVAWADGAVLPEERQAVLRAAVDAGMATGSAGLQLLEAWLHTPPRPALAEAWAGYVAALAHRMAPEARSALARHALSQARAVAEVAGGFLGLGNRISTQEKAVMARLEAAFHP